MIRTNIYIEEKQWEKIREMAHKQRCTRSHIVRDSIDEHIKKEEAKKVFKK